MKLLLDENLPVKLRSTFSKTYLVSAVSDMGWSGEKNGELLGLMIMNGFEGLITIDKNLKHQKNLNKFDVQIFILDATDNKLSTLKPFIKELEQSISQSLTDKIIEVNIH